MILVVGLPILIYCLSFWGGILSGMFFKMDNTLAPTLNDKKSSTDTRYDAFEMRAENNPEKLGAWNDIALDVKRESAELIEVIDSIRQKLVQLAGVDEDGKLISLDDKEITIDVLVKAEEDDGYGYGKKLKEARTKYRDFLLSLDSLQIYEGRDSIYKINIISLFANTDFDSDGPEGKAEPRSWEYKYYGHVPVAAMAFMNQMKLDVGNMEGSVLELLEEVTEKK